MKKLDWPTFIGICVMFFVAGAYCYLLRENPQKENQTFAQAIPRIMPEAKEKKAEDQKPIQLEAENTKDVCTIHDWGKGLYGFYFENSLHDFMVDDFFKTYLVDFLDKNPNLRITCIYNLYREHGQYIGAGAKILVVTEEKK